MIGFVVLGYDIYWAAKGQAAKVDNQEHFLGEFSQVHPRIPAHLGISIDWILC